MHVVTKCRYTADTGKEILATAVYSGCASLKFGIQDGDADYLPYEEAALNRHYGFWWRECCVIRMYVKGRHKSLS